jgi:hypothetical protein
MSAMCGHSVPGAASYGGSREDEFGFTVADEPAVVGSTNKHGEAQEDETAEPLAVRCREETQRLERAIEAISFSRTEARFLGVCR